MDHFRERSLGHYESGARGFSATHKRSIAKD